MSQCDHRKRRMGRRVSRGFTLIELMIVMTIIVVLASLAFSNLGSKKTAPIKAATNDMIGFLQDARTRAAAGFRAVGVEVDWGVPNPGVLTMHESLGPECAQVDWANSIGTLNLAASDTYGGTTGHGAGADVRIVQVTPSTVTRVCVTPDGRVLDGGSGLPIAGGMFADYGAGDFILTFQAHYESSPIGMRHHVVFSFGGSARFTFGDDPLAPIGGEGGA